MPILSLSITLDAINFDFSFLQGYGTRGMRPIIPVGTKGRETAPFPSLYDLWFAALQLGGGGFPSGLFGGLGFVRYFYGHFRHSFMVIKDSIGGLGDCV
jgi:hypothetical protein